MQTKENFEYLTINRKHIGKIVKKKFETFQNYSNNDNMTIDGLVIKLTDNALTTIKISFKELRWSLYFNGSRTHSGPFSASTLRQLEN